MKSHLDIKVNGNDLRILPDQSLDINFSNPLFNDTESYTYPVELPVDGNRKVATIVDDINSKVRLIDIENAPAQIIADGLPIVAGKVVTDEDAEINGKFSFNVDSKKGSFKDMIANLKCSDIPLIDDIQIGEIIGEIKADATITLTRTVTVNEGTRQNPHWVTTTETRDISLSSGTVTPQALGFSYPGKCQVDNNQYAVLKEERTYARNKKVKIPKVTESYINVTDAYPVKKYCNARVCYKHYDIKLDEKNENQETNESGDLIDPKDSTGNYEDIWPYWVLDADRQQSGICFYVLYFLDCLFAHLGIAWDNTELLQIEDMKHLAFFTTQCKFRTERLHGTEENPFYHDTYTSPVMESYSTKDRTDEDGVQLPNINGWMESRGCGGKMNLNVEYTSSTIGNGSDPQQPIEKNTKMTVQEHYDVTANIMAMYATQDNFPKENVSTLIESLENAFGIRFIYDQEANTCKAILLREIFRNAGTPQKMLGKVLTVYPVNEKIKGVRVCYSEESEKREQQEFIREGKRDYDTRFDYTDFSEDRVIDDDNYADFFAHVSPTDEHCYIDQDTGNAYRIKVDADATTFGELKPVIFQVAHLHGVESGDCSQENEDFVQEISIGFEPIDLTDVNYRKEQTQSNPYAVNAVYIDEEMEHEFLTHKICNTFSSPRQEFGDWGPHVECSLVETLNTIESYDPTKTEDGNSPLQHIDWGMAIGLMRGGGSDANIQNFDDDYDGFGNSRWTTVSGTYQMDIDTMDAFGNDYDYNGSSPGIGGGERFSLKIRAYQYPDWADAPLCDPDIYDGNTLVKKIRSRGLFESFLAEYVHFLLNRKKLRYTILMQVSEIIAIKNGWLKWWDIEGKIGLIDKATCSIDAQNGIGAVTIDLLSI